MGDKGNHIEIPEGQHPDNMYLSNDDTEKAMKNLVQNIYEDMNEVDMTDAEPEGLVRRNLPRPRTASLNCQSHTNSG